MIRKWDLLGIIVSSSYRHKVLTIVANGKAKTPKQIAKESDIKLSHISGVLRQLEKYNLINCLNPSLKKGKLYIATKLGKNTIKEILKCV